MHTAAAVSVTRRQPDALMGKSFEQNSKEQNTQTSQQPLTFFPGLLYQMLANFLMMQNDNFVYTEKIRDNQTLGYHNYFK